MQMLAEQRMGLSSTVLLHTSFGLGVCICSKLSFNNPKEDCILILAQEQAELDALYEDFKSFVQMSAKSRIRDTTLDNYIMNLNILIRDYGLPTENPTMEDFSRVLKKRLRNLAASTANTTIVVARKFAEFRGLDPDSREMRKIFRFKRVIPTKRFTREDILVPEDIVRILDLMPSRHYRALFAVLWDTGARIGEICALDYEDITKDEHGYVLHLKESKTVARRVRLLTDIGLDNFTPHYENYRSGFLFQKRNGSRITPVYAGSVLRNRRERIGKKLCPQLFRKSASSWWKSSGLLDDRDIRIRMGHKPWSKMFERYYELYFRPDYEAAELRALNGNHEEPESKPDQEKDLLDTIAKLTERIEELEKEKDSQEDGPSIH